MTLISLTFTSLQIRETNRWLTVLVFVPLPKLPLFAELTWKNPPTRKIRAFDSSSKRVNISTCNLMVVDYGRYSQWVRQQSPIVGVVDSWCPYHSTRNQSKSDRYLQRRNNLIPTIRQSFIKIVKVRAKRVWKDIRENRYTVMRWGVYSSGSLPKRL